MGGILASARSAQALSFSRPTVTTLQAEIAAVAAALIVEGLSTARQPRGQALCSDGRAEPPDNDQIEDAVKEYITVFCGDTCNRLSWLALRAVWLWSGWSAWLTSVRTWRAPWHGTATRLSDIYIQLFAMTPSRPRSSG
jgi:hypothetical protein